MPHRSFDPEAVSVMGLALDAAWAEVERSTPVRGAPEKAGIRRALALRIMAAVRAGQRDPERLCAVALHVVEGCRIVRADAHSPAGH